MGSEAADYGGNEDDRVSEWETGLPCADDLTPLSQLLIPPELASAFNIKPERTRTLFEVNRASAETLSGIRRGGQIDLVMLEDDDEEEGRSDFRKIRRIDLAESGDSGVGGEIEIEIEIENENENENSVDDQSARMLKKARLVWTPQLHRRFVDVVGHLGIKNAVPKTIMQMMNVEGLTRENVASHLQKYRLYLKRMQGLSNEGPSASDPLFASTPIPRNLHESGRNGGSESMVPMPYGPMMVPMPVYGHMGMPMAGYNGMEAHHQHAYSMMQQNYNGSAVSYHRATPSHK